MAAAPLSFQHDTRPDGGRFWARLPGGQVELDYQLDGRRALFVHTGVDPALEGQGLAAQVVRTAWDWAQARGLEVVPVCSYVEAWMRRHGR